MSQRVLPLKAKTFAFLFKELQDKAETADIFELHLDDMTIKGDLAVIRNRFQKPMIVRASDLDWLKRGVKAGMPYAELPHDLMVDLEFVTLTKNKGAKLIRAYREDYETPPYGLMLDALERMAQLEHDYLKIHTRVDDHDDMERLLRLLEEPDYEGRLILGGHGELARRLQLEAKHRGALFHYL